MVDLVVLYVDDRDIEWQKDFMRYLKKEKPETLQATSRARTRSWDNLQYFFRGVENNLSWINKVFLVVQRESQLPKWLNRNYEKLRIVYHNEFIPKKYLPVFSTHAIQTFLTNIEDLSECFILADDDDFFINPIPKEQWWRNGLPVYKDNKEYGVVYKNNVEWFRTLNNDNNLVYKYTKNYTYNFEHLAVLHTKSFNKRMLEENPEIIENVTRFREPNNYCYEVMEKLHKAIGECIFDDPYYKCIHLNINKSIDLNYFKNKRMINFNDNEATEFEECKKKVNEFLEQMLPNKSKYEL